MALPTAQRWMLVAIVIGMVLSCWGALYPQNTWLQVGPVGFALPLAYWALVRWPLSNRAAGCLTAFVLLHLVAARWSYSFVPYQLWAGHFGLNIDRAFGFHRNMFDRLVHFLFGVWMMPAIAEIARRHGGASPRLALVVAIFFVFGISSLYEIFEWSLTMTLSPADAGAYNGEQGDMFDSQKDMASAAVGGVLALPWAARHLRRWA